MNKIEQLIKEKCSNGVEYKKLEEVCLLQAGDRITTSMMNETYAFDVIGGGTFPTGRYNKYNREHCITVSRAGSAGFVNWQEGKFWATDVCFTASNAKAYMNIKFLYYYLKNSQFDLQKHIYGGSMPKLNKLYLWKYLIPIPPIEVQEEIVKILDNFSELEEELEEELEARKKQYEFYREKLIISTSGRKGKLIELLSQPITDGPHTTPKFVSNGIPFISAGAIHGGKIHLNEAQGFITQEFDAECSKKYKPKQDDVFMVKSGSTTGKVAIVDTDTNFNIWSPLAAMRTNNKTTARFLYHLLQTEIIQNQVKNKKSQGSQPNLSMRVLEKFEVKIPPLKEQERIVKILDKFDKLVNDISEGIPAEIEARRKQYEYYRNKLLSFEEINDEK